MASFQNTFRNERGITSSSSSSSTSTSSSSQEFNYYYDYDDDNESSSILNIFYKLFWGSTPAVVPSSTSVCNKSNDSNCDLRN